MNYGLYLSASGVLTNMYRQNVLANNLANVQTTGFKPDIPAIMQRQPESIEDPQEFGLEQPLLDRLGGGVLAGPQHISFQVGMPQATGNNLDAMIQRENEFFLVRGANGELGLTRDGRFTLNDQGQLATASGHVVLGPDRQPVTPPPGADLKLTPTGELVNGEGEAVAALGLFQVNDPVRKLVKKGENLFTAADEKAIQPVANIDLKPGFIEASGTNAVTTLMQIVSAAKASMASARLIQYHDLTMDRAINTLARIA